MLSAWAWAILLIVFLCLLYVDSFRDVPAPALFLGGVQSLLCSW